MNLEDDMSADASPCDGQCRFDIMPGGPATSPRLLAMAQ